MSVSSDLIHLPVLVLYPVPHAKGAVLGHTLVCCIGPHAGVVCMVCVCVGVCVGVWVGGVSEGGMMSRP